MKNSTLKNSGLNWTDDEGYCGYPTARVNGFAFVDEQIYGPCHYFHELGDDCTSCPARDDACAVAVMRDVASRIRNLRGEDE